MNFFKPFVLDVTKSICLVPPSGEHVEGDLASNGESESVIPKFLLEGLDELLANLVLLKRRVQPSNHRALKTITHLVIFLELDTFLDTIRFIMSSRPKCIAVCTYDALRPIGLTLIIPLRNSKNVPLSY